MRGNNTTTQQQTNKKPLPRRLRFADAALIITLNQCDLLLVLIEGDVNTVQRQRILLMPLVSVRHVMRARFQMVKETPAQNANQMK